MLGSEWDVDYTDDTTAEGTIRLAWWGSVLLSLACLVVWFFI